MLCQTGCAIEKLCAVACAYCAQKCFERLSLALNAHTALVVEHLKRDAIIETPKRVKDFFLPARCPRLTKHIESLTKQRLCDGKIIQQSSKELEWHSESPTKLARPVYRVSAR